MYKVRLLYTRGEIVSNEIVTDNNQQAPIQPEENSKTENIQSDKEQNFAALREAKEKLERENEEYKNYFNALKEESEKQLAAQKEEVDEDGFVTNKDLKKIHRELQDIKKSQEQAINRQVPHLLKQRFSDFEEVVSEKNLNNLSKQEPELFETLKNGSNLYNTGVSAYKTVKSMLEQNKLKPRSAQAIAGQGGLSDANAFTGDLSEEAKNRLVQQTFAAAQKF